MEFYRVLNWNPAARTPSENGHPLFVWPAQGHGRVDDPADDYLVLYVGSDQDGAVAEAFGRFPVWSPAILEVPAAAPTGTKKALVKYTGTPHILDMDDPRVLADLGLRPSQVINRDYKTTQQWARSVFDTGKHDGLSWWSFYGAQWSSIGLWNWRSLSVEGDPEVLTLSHPAVELAAAEIARTITPK
ncbi:hypothetical protein IWX65_002886 [Arthrobacter sp. CAN_A214]|uniref:RES domain-containing protein n=1 Tax=Arthrobacter sp. CAN_A214 TaxID=2787720 RepID=UPI0018C971A7